MSETRPTTKPVAGTFFYILLALADRPRYGLGIVEEVALRTRGAAEPATVEARRRGESATSDEGRWSASPGEVRLGPGTLYNAIRKMLDEGLIEECDAPPESYEEAPDPRRRYYRITGAGRDALASEAGRLEQLVLAARDKRVLPASS